MNGIVKWGFLSILGITLYSCGSENLYDPEKAGELKLARYEAAFIEKYGEINPNQDWGFGKTATRAVIKEEHKFGNDIERPAKVTDDEIKIVSDWFDTHPNPTTINLNWSDLWIVPILHSNNASQMNQIVIGEEINDYNGGTDGLRLIKNGNTNEFGYHNSTTDQWFKNENYTIQKIGNNYYLGFYYHGHKYDNGDKYFGDQDNLYNDWIFRLVPAKYTNADRVMAEDLNDTNGDFDFNDVVFDAAIMNDGTTIITLQAAGGTMPLYIEGKEVHELFGVSETTMVNTQEGHKNAVPCVIFRLEGDYTDIKDIPIAVNGVELRAESGKAPGKLCCPTNCEWTDERENIEKRYQNFQSNIKTGVDWWK